MNNDLISDFINMSGEGFAYITPDNNIEFANPAFARIFDFSSSIDVEGKNILDLFPNHYTEQIIHIENLPENEKIFEFEFDILTRKGNRKQIKINLARKFNDLKCSGTIYQVSDLTLIKQADENIQMLDKYKSLELYCKGIAHDCNNILSAIIGNIDLTKSSFETNSEHYKSLEIVEEAAYRATLLITDIRDSMGVGNYNCVSTSLQDVVSESLRLLPISSKITCDVKIGSNLRMLSVDEIHIYRILANLILNAQQAMPEGGKLNIVCENTNGGKIDGDLSPGNYIKILISDHGCGIPDHIINRIYDPYFTTKNRGTGLGLTACKAIINQYNGFINVKSQINKGTTFTIYLPAKEQDPQLETAPDLCASKILDDTEFDL